MQSPSINGAKERITNETGYLFVNGELFEDGCVLEIIMIANILCNTLLSETYGVMDLNDIKLNMRIGNLVSIPQGALIQVYDQQDNGVFIGKRNKNNPYK